MENRTLPLIIDPDNVERNACTITNLSIKFIESKLDTKVDKNK